VKRDVEVSMTSIQFGTDGWRGKIAEDFTFDNVRRCAQGFANYLAAHGKGGTDIVIGHDRRFASRDFAIAAAEVMAANGHRVWLTEGSNPDPRHLLFRCGAEGRRSDQHHRQPQSPLR
jgi:Phosphomannomutase